MTAKRLKVIGIFGGILMLSLCGFPSSANAGTFLPDDPYTDIDYARPVPNDLSYLDINDNFVIFVTSYMKHVYPDTIPLPEEVTNKIKGFATLGEYEPLSFSVRARKKLHGLQVKISPLVLKERYDANVMDPEQSVAKIQGKNLDLRMVRVMKMPYEGSLRKPEEVPEILDHVKPINLEKNAVKQYWLTLKIPNKAVPGVYKGVIKVWADNAAMQKIQVVFFVYPVRLISSPYKYHGIYHRPQLVFNHNGQRVDLSDRFGEFVEASWRDIREHGGEMLTLSVPLPIEGYGGNIRCDWQNTIQAFHLYKNLGFKKPIIIGFINAAFYNALLKRTRNDSKLADQIFQREVEACLNTAKNMGISVYFYPVDEAHGKIKEEDQKDHESFALWHYDKSLAFKHLASLIKSVPETKVYLTSIHDFFQKPDIDRLVDVRNYNGQYTKKHNYTWKDWHQIDADVAASGDTMLSYYNTHGNGGRPEYYRVINGLWMLKKTRMVGHLPWTYQMIPQNGEIFDLFREDAPLCFAYPDPDNHFLPTLPSLRWEGFREGVDDIKYIYTLRRAIERAEKEGKPVAEIRLAKRLHQHLMNLITQSGPEAVTLARDFFYEDYQEFRKDFVESIIRLGYAVPPYGEGEK